MTNGRYLFLLAFFALFTLAAGESDIAVVPDTPVENLSLADIRKLLLGDRQFWTSNLRVTLLIRAPAAREREVVLRAIY